jgi:hypothetical protein
LFVDLILNPKKTIRKRYDSFIKGDLWICRGAFTALGECHPRGVVMSLEGGRVKCDLSLQIP